VATSYDRDLIGYGADPPHPQWPGNARVAINFVMNYEEGSEPSVQDGEGYTENALTDAQGRNQDIQGRDLAAEGLFEYGCRVGFWRLMRWSAIHPRPPPVVRQASMSVAMAGAGLNTTC
jgi:hypothetical protein